VSKKAAMEKADRKSDGRERGQVYSNDYGLNFDSGISPNFYKNMTNYYCEMRGVMNAMVFGTCLPWVVAFGIERYGSPPGPLR
jgi:hypothetical protein